MDTVIAAISSIQRRWQLYYSSLLEPDPYLKEYYAKVGACLDVMRSRLLQGDVEAFDRAVDGGMAREETWTEALDVLFQELGITQRDELCALLKG
jgi:hypothetical protein